MLITFKTGFEIKSLISHLWNEFEIKYLGQVKGILGMNIIGTKSWLFLSQQSYVQKVLKRFSMYDSKHISVPLGAHFDLSLNDCPNYENDKNYVKRIPYSYAISLLMYACYALYQTTFFICCEHS